MRVRYPENIDREWSIEPAARRLLFAIELQKSNPLECLEILHELAQNGSNLAKCYIGDAYANGRDVDRDIECGMQWYQSASDSGSIEASHRLAFWLWYQGKFDVSVEIMKNIGERGFSPALFVLGSIYFSDYDNHNINHNAGLALKYWQEAEAIGNLIAKRRISIFLRRKKSGAFDKFRGYLKLFRLIPEFMYFSMKYPMSDRMRGWTHGAGAKLH